MVTWLHLEMGCMGSQVLEILETQEWETRLGSNQERSHLRLMLHWERNLLLQVSCRFQHWGTRLRRLE